MAAVDAVGGTWRVIAPDAAAVAGRLGLRAGDENPDWILRDDGKAWTLEDSAGRRLAIDFDEPGPDYRRRAPRGRGELLARALGKGAGKIADLTAGLGQDAVFLSQLGFDVTAVERHPVLGFLLEEARRRSKRADLAKLKIIARGAREWMDAGGSGGFDAAYFDPMYPMKKKSALPRQEMVIFRALVGDDADAAGVAERAREEFPRLVIKRPLDAPPLLPKPTATFEGTTVRYDVYVRS